MRGLLSRREKLNKTNPPFLPMWSLRCRNRKTKKVAKLPHDSREGWTRHVPLAPGRRAETGLGRPGWGEKREIHGGQRPWEPGSGGSADPRPLVCGRDTPPPRCTSGKKTGCRSTNTSLQAHPQPPPTSICESQGRWASKILSLFSLLAATASPLAGGLGSDCADCVQTLGWTLFPSQGTETEAWSPLRTVGPGSAMDHVSPARLCGRGGGKVETRTPGRGGHGRPPGPPAPGPSPRAGWVP